MSWQQALLFPDPEYGWQQAAEPLLGIPALVRMLLVLKRAGVSRVFMPPDGRHLKSCVESFARPEKLPAVHWTGGLSENSPGTSFPRRRESRKPRQTWIFASAGMTVKNQKQVLGQPHSQDIEAIATDGGDGPVLGVCWGALFDGKVVSRFWEMCQQGRGDRLSLATCDSRPILISGNWEALLALWQAGFPLGDISARLGGIEHSLPNEYFCAEIRKLVARDGDRLLLRTVGKATDRWHVVWVRNWSFPALRRLASVRVTPNQITVAGFLLALAACLVMARGGYWGGVCGAALLYLSWVLDCMDGTLARLTFAESDFGQRLDTVLGHVTNFAIFSALIWAVYGAASPWRTVLFAVGILGGITLAYRFSKEAKRLLPAAASTSSPPGQNMERFLDKINHRDYAVVIFVLALVQGFQVFLWLSLVGVQIFWLLQLRLIATRRNNLDPSVPQSLNS